METTKSKAILSLSVYMYFADISIVNSGVREAYAHVYQLVTLLNVYKTSVLILACDYGEAFKIFM